MKILIISLFPPPITGVSMASQILFEGLEKDHTVEKVNMITGKSFGNLSNQGRASFSKLLKTVYKIFHCVPKIIFSSRLDIIYITPGQTVAGYLKYAPIMWAAQFKKIPYFIHIHGGYFRTMYDGLRGWKKRAVDNSLKGLAGAIVLGPSLRFMFEGLVPDEKIFVCENGVEDEIFATEEEIRQKIERYKTDDTIRVVYLSNLMESKGILDLFEAVKMLRNRGEKIHLDVAGAIEPAIEARVRECLSELGDAVTYHGIVKGKKKKELLLNNYIFCLPTYYPNEGQPISILEAMANGCVIFTTDHGGIRDIVNEEYGVFVEKHNPESIAETIAKRNYDDVIHRSWLEAKSKYGLDQFVSRIENALLKPKSKKRQRDG